jgi:hypothetical protein
MLEAEMLRQLFGYRALAGRGRAINGNDERGISHGSAGREKVAPRSLINPSKAGSWSQSPVHHHRHRLTRAKAHDQKGHGDAMIKMGDHRATARHVARAYPSPSANLRHCPL